MKMTHLVSAALVSLAIGFAGGPVGAQDFAKGFAAYNAGDFAAALVEWRPLAEQGYAPAQHNLALMYYEGKGVPQDYTEAARWYCLAAEQGNADAQTNLGLAYARRSGANDHEKAQSRFCLQLSARAAPPRTDGLGFGRLHLF